MIKLDPGTINEFVEILRPFVESERERQSFLVAALGNDASVLQRISWSGAVASFLPHMVGKLADYGGGQTLCVVLEYARSQMSVHEDVQQRIDRLLNQLSNLSASYNQSISSPIVNYRQKLEEIASDGNISISGRHILDDFKKKLGISEEEVVKIEAEFLQRFNEYQKHLDEFLQILYKQVNHNLLFSDKTRNELEELQRTWDLKMEDIEALYIFLGNKLYNQNRLEQSISIYKELLNISPVNTIIHENLAYILLKYGQINDAIIEYQNAIILAPNKLKLRVDLGNIFYTKSEFDKAIEQYQDAIKINSDNTEIHLLGKIYYLLGRALFQCERFEDSIAAYQQAININRQCAEAHAELGMAMYRVENFVQAIALLEKSIQINQNQNNPDNPDFYRDLGIVLSNQRKYKDAITRFKHAIRINVVNGTPDPITYTHYAITLLAQNKQKQAETEIQLAIELFRKQNMLDEAEEMENLFEEIKRNSSWRNIFKRFP